MKIKNTLFISLAGLAFSLSCTHAAIVFADDFSGGTTNLDDVSPDTGAVNWVATPMFDSNGNVNITDADGTGRGSATLAFTPVDDMIYTAEGSASLSVGGSGDFLAFGFANGQSNEDSSNNRFLGTLTTGRAWMYNRENTNNPAAHLEELLDGTGWTGFTTSPRNVDYKIVLDTTGGTGAWTATWFAKDTSSSSFTEVRSTATLTAEDITSVGFAIAGPGTTAQLHSFSLTAVPEPSTYAAILGGLAVLFVFIRRRRS